MKLFSFLLLLAAFIQTAFLPLNICLVILICRSYAIHSKENYYLAIIAGLFIGILSPVNWGFWPLVFSASVALIHMIRLLPITGRLLMVVPVAFLILTLSNGIESLFLQAPFIWWYGALSSLIALPIFIAVRTWEERFIVKSGIKLKV